MEYEKFEIGQSVRLDKKFRNTSIVEVIWQSSTRMFTTVKSNESEWDVMTRRLSVLKVSKTGTVDKD